MFSKLKRIFLAKLSTRCDHSEDFQLERKKICDTCPFNSLNTDKGEKKLRYRILSFLNGHRPFCKICGCELLLKQKEELEECPKGKWGKFLM